MEKQIKKKKLGIDPIIKDCELELPSSLPKEVEIVKYIFAT